MLTRSRSGHLKNKQGCSQQHALHLAEEAKKKEEVLCFDNAICFSLAIWFALRDPPREVRSVGELISLLCLSLPLLSLSLPWRRRSLVLAFPCIFLFLSGRKNTNTAGPGLRLLAFDVPSSTCFFWRCKPSNRKFLRASPRRFVLPAL